MSGESIPASMADVNLVETRSAEKQLSLVWCTPKIMFFEVGFRHEVKFALNFRKF